MDGRDLQAQAGSSTAVATATPPAATGARGDLLLIGDVASLTGLSAHALRAWERVGLLAPRRTPGGVRQYTADDLARIRLIARTLDTRRLSRRTVAALLHSGELRPDTADYAPGTVGARRSRSRTTNAAASNRSAADTARDNACLYEGARNTVAELNAVFNAMAEGVRVCDASGQVTQVNPAGVALLGLSPERALQSVKEYLETNLPRWPNGQPIPPTEVPQARALRGETDSNYELILRQADTGRDLWLRSSYAPIRDEATGAIVGAVSVDHDVTHLKHLEQARDEFLAIAAHELKTPLTTLLGFVQVARRKRARSAASLNVDGPPTSREWQDLDALFERIERQALRLDRLVSDMLDVVRVEQGRLEYRWTLGDVSGAVAEAVDAQRAAHPDRRIEQITPEGPLMVRLDADRIEQVAINLLTNALKYSRMEEPVVVTVAADPGAPVGTAEAVVRVRDQGPGIPAEYLPHLFERFYRVPGVEVRSGSGVGLGVGLYLAKSIVERHSGRIWVESEPGKGSTFIFALPLASAPVPS
jgi:PAS domain S-box-containing protein